MSSRVVVKKLKKDCEPSPPYHWTPANSKLGIKAKCEQDIVNPSQNEEEKQVQPNVDKDEEHIRRIVKKTKKECEPSPPFHWTPANSKLGTKAKCEEDIIKPSQQNEEKEIKPISENAIDKEIKKVIVKKTKKECEPNPPFEWTPANSKIGTKAKCEENIIVEKGTQPKEPLPPIQKSKEKEEKYVPFNKLKEVSCEDKDINFFREHLKKYIDKFPNLQKSSIDKMKKDELCSLLLEAPRAVKKTKVVPKEVLFYDPTINGLFLSQNPGLKSFLDELVDEVLSTLLRFLDYLVLPQRAKCADKNCKCMEEGCERQPIWGLEPGTVLFCDQHKQEKSIYHVRKGYHSITSQSVKDKNIDYPTISLNMMKYILEYVLPFKHVFNIHKTNIFDMKSHTINPYSVTVEGITYQINLITVYTNEELVRLLVNRKTKTLQYILDINNGKREIFGLGTLDLLRDFLGRVVSLVLPVSKNPSEMRNTLIQSTTKVGYFRQIQNVPTSGKALLSIITSGTDWLEKRNMDIYDVLWGSLQLFGFQDEYVYRWIDLPYDPSNNELMDYYRSLFIENNIIPDMVALQSFVTIIYQLYNNQEVNSRIKYREEMFSQL